MAVHGASRVVSTPEGRVENSLVNDDEDDAPNVYSNMLCVARDGDWAMPGLDDNSALKFFGKEFRGLLKTIRWLRAWRSSDEPPDQNVIDIAVHGLIFNWVNSQSQWTTMFDSANEFETYSDRLKNYRLPYSDATIAYIPKNMHAFRQYFRTDRTDAIVAAAAKQLDAQWVTIQDHLFQLTLLRMPEEAGYTTHTDLPEGWQKLAPQFCRYDGSEEVGSKLAPHHAATKDPRAVESGLAVTCVAYVLPRNFRPPSAKTHAAPSTIHLHTPHVGATDVAPLTTSHCPLSTTTEDGRRPRTVLSFFESTIPHMVGFTNDIRGAVAIKFCVTRPRGQPPVTWFEFRAALLAVCRDRQDDIEGHGRPTDDPDSVKVSAISVTSVERQ